MYKKQVDSHFDDHFDSKIVYHCDLCNNKKKYEMALPGSFTDIIMNIIKDQSLYFMLLFYFVVMNSWIIKYFI